MFSLIGMAIFGLVVGVIAKFVLPGKDPGGIIVTAIIGMVGSLVGTWIGQTFLGYRQGQSAGWIMSIVGAILLLLAYRMVFGRKQ